MPVSNVWDNDEKTIIRMEARALDMDEICGVHGEFTHVESVRHCLSHHDFSQSHGMPNNAITHARNMMGKQHRAPA
jgi:hypothetical protein